VDGLTPEKKAESVHLRPACVTVAGSAGVERKLLATSDVRKGPCRQAHVRAVAGKNALAIPGGWSIIAAGRRGKGGDGKIHHLRGAQYGRS